MGCDIHGYVEIKDERPETLNKYLEGYKPPWNPFICAGDYLDRNYNLFGALAGVRWYDPEWGWTPIAMNRGIPEDASYEVRDGLRYYDSQRGEFLDNIDYHSRTWMTFDEIEAFNWKYPMKEYGEYRGKGQFEMIDTDLWDVIEDSGFHDVYDCMELLSKKYGPKNVRLVIWFDN